MQRIKLTIEYDGTFFYGWQKQKNLLSIQETLENSLRKFFNQEISLYVAGRTDRGVHAYKQVAHFDVTLKKEYRLHQIKVGVNKYLNPALISIIDVEFVNIDFHARFSAIKKSYIYKIINRPSLLTFQKNYAWHIPQKLDIEKMQDTSQFLIGTHDFSSFKGPDCQSHTTIRTIDFILINKSDDEISIEFQAKSFLNNQIRIMVGTLKKISIFNSKYNPEEIKNIMKAKNRCAAGETAPACGLFLQWIQY